MSELSSLAEIRGRIDELDEQLTDLLARRQDLVRAAAAFKKDEHAVRAPDRADAVIQAARRRATAAGLSPDVAEAIWRAMIQAFTEYELARHREEEGAPRGNATD